MPPTLIKFKDKFEVKKFSAISSSDDFSESRVTKGEQRLPYNLQRGAQSVWFDKTKIETDKIIKLEGKFFYVPIKKSNFVDMMDTYLTSSLSPQAYTQISASFFSKMTSMGDDELIGIMAEDGPPPTASYSFSPRTGISPYTTTTTNNSTFTTGATHSLGAGGAANISSSTITGSDLSQERGKILTSSYSNLFNGAGSGLGAISIKTKVLGDGELTDSSIFYYTAFTEFLIFPQGLSGSVGSSSLKYAKLSGNVAASSPITIYHSGSSINWAGSGSYLFLSEDLRSTASAGWYAADGSSTAYEVPQVDSYYAAKRPSGNTTII